MTEKEMAQRYQELCAKDDGGDDLTDEENTEFTGLYYWLNGYEDMLPEGSTPYDVWGVPGPDAE